jgi:hypothetical protein
MVIILFNITLFGASPLFPSLLFEGLDLVVSIKYYIILDKRVLLNRVQHTSWSEINP